MAKSQKNRNIAQNNKVSFVVDDITSRDPWRVRCLEYRGTAEQAQIPASRGAAGDQLNTAIIQVTRGASSASASTIRTPSRTS